mgnify:CR=1 FL=1
MTFDDLRAEGFAEAIIEALLTLTKTKGEDRVAAAHRAGQHPIARNVKLADVSDNMNQYRIPNPTEKDLASVPQYEEVRKILLSYGAASK